MKIQNHKIGQINYLKFNINEGNRDLIFLHANAFPPECYIPLFKEWGEKFNIVCPLFKPLWDEPDNFKNLKTWTPLKDDMVRFLENYGDDKYIIAGHSLGGHVGFRIALENKHLVEKMILMDPIIFPKLKFFIWQFIQWTEFGRNIPELTNEIGRIKSTSGFY